MRISKNHGVNPSIVKCYLCGEDVLIALLGYLKDDAKAPHTIVTGEICDKCKEYMKKGIILIEVADNDKDYRMGGYAVVKDSLIKRLVDNEKLIAEILEKRVCFIQSTIYKNIVRS